MSALVIYSVEELARLLRCAPTTVEEWARQGKLRGIKPGGEWVFPAGALAEGLDILATEEAQARRQPPKPAATSTGQPAAGDVRRGRRARALPKLVDLTA